MYNISDEIKMRMKDVLSDNNISNEEKKHIIVDIFAELFGKQQSSQQSQDDDSFKYDPEYAAGYNLGKWFASETYKNHGHEPNTENMIEIPKRERMRLLESFGQKIPKDERLFGIIGNNLSIDQKIQMIIDLFMEPEDGNNNQQQNQQQNQQNNQQQNQQNQEDDSQDTNDSSSNSNDDVDNQNGSGNQSQDDESDDDDVDNQNGSGSQSQDDDGDDADNQNGSGSQSQDDEGDDDSYDDEGDGDELDDLLNSSKASENNSSNNDYDFGDVVMGNDHVISQEDGENIRQSENAKVTNNDKRFGEEGETSIELLDDLYDSIKSKLTDEDKEIVQKINNDLKQKILRAKKGIIDWKRVLHKHMNSLADEYEKGGLRKNLYTMSHIGLYHPKPKKQLKKCVVYIDTSGSVNNSSTQLVPLMLAEIGKIAKDCHFSSVDVNLFHHSVYTDVNDPDVIDRTKNIKPSRTLKKDWGILSEDGGTNIQEVYRSIERNYIKDGKLKREVSTIIIITDVEGIMESGYVDRFKDKFSKSVFKKMIYIIYDRYKDVHKGMLTAKVDEVVSPYSTHIEIGLNDFKRQIKARFTNESNKDIKDMRKIYLNEASLADRRKSRDEQKAIIQSGDQEKISDVLRKDAIAGGRIIGGGANDRYFKPIKDIVGRIFPMWEETNDSHLLSKGNLYYITDEMNIRIGTNVNKDNIDNFAVLCDRLYNEVGCKVEELYGDVIIEHDPTFKKFPPYFPDVVNGKLVLSTLINMETFKGAPTRVVKAIVHTNRYIYMEEKAYVNLLRKRGAIVRSLSGVVESMSQIVNERILLGESYIKENVATKMILPSYRTIGKNDDASNRKTLDVIRMHNEWVNKNVLLKYGVQLGSISDEEFSIVDNPLDVRKLINHLFDGSVVVSLKNAHKIANDIIKSDKKVPINPKLLALLKSISGDGKSPKEKYNQGIRIFTDSNNTITMVILVSKKNISDNHKYKILYLNNRGKHIIDPVEIENVISERYEIYTNQLQSMMEKYGFNPHTLANKDKTRTIRDMLTKILAVTACKYLGYKLRNDSYDYTKYIKNIDDHFLIKDYVPQSFNSSEVKKQKGYSILGVMWGKSAEEVKQMERVGGRYVFKDGTLAMGNGLIPYTETEELKKFNSRIDENADIASMFTDDFLRMVVYALNVFPYNSVASMNRESLVSVVNRSLFVQQKDTLFVKMSDIENLKKDYDYNFLTLFADRLQKSIDVMMPYEHIKSIADTFDNVRGMVNSSDNLYQYPDIKGKLDKYSDDEKTFLENRYQKSVNYLSGVTGERKLDDALNVYVSDILPDKLDWIYDEVAKIEDVIKQTKVKSIFSKYEIDIDNVNSTISMVSSIVSNLVKKMDGETDVYIIRKGIPEYIDNIVKKVALMGNIFAEFLSSKKDNRTIDTFNNGITQMYDAFKGMLGIEDIDKEMKGYYKRRMVKKVKSSPKGDKSSNQVANTSQGSNGGVNLDKLRKSFLDVVSEFSDAINNVDPNNGKNPKLINKFNTFMSDFDYSVKSVIEKIDAAKSSYAEFDKNVYDKVNLLVRGMYDVINSVNDGVNDSLVIDLCVLGSNSIDGIMGDIDNININDTQHQQVI